MDWKHCDCVNVHRDRDDAQHILNNTIMTIHSEGPRGRGRKNFSDIRNSQLGCCLADLCLLGIKFMLFALQCILFDKVVVGFVVPTLGEPCPARDL